MCNGELMVKTGVSCGCLGKNIMLQAAAPDNAFMIVVYYWGLPGM